VLLHGFPASSRQYGGLIRALARRYHVIAPDYLGFGHSDAPAADEFPYTFDRLADAVAGLLDQMGLDRYSMYLHDYGGPIGFRIALAEPERVEGLIIQNAVAHVEGLSDEWKVRKAFWEDRTRYEEELRQALLSADVVRRRHTAGARRSERVDPETWSEELAFLRRPGMDRIQLDLMYDYRSNVAAYPKWQAYLRQRQPPSLLVWGRHDPLFTVAGALAFGRELPEADIHLLNAGHFALEEEGDLIADLVLRFLDRDVGHRRAAAPAPARREEAAGLARAAGRARRNGLSWEAGEVRARRARDFSRSGRSPGRSTV
jgi:pimeloyl-ACP methyl ester carboxylesterase